MNSVSECNISVISLRARKWFELFDLGHLQNLLGTLRHLSNRAAVALSNALHWRLHTFYPFWLKAANDEDFEKLLVEFRQLEIGIKVSQHTFVDLFDSFLHVLMLFRCVSVYVVHATSFVVL